MSDCKHENNRDGVTFCCWCGDILRTEGRERQEWWVTHNLRVICAEGLCLAPEQPGMWFFPSLRDTRHTSSLYTTRQPAVTTLLRKLDHGIAELQAAREELLKP